MALVLKDRVRETSTSTGTGALTLAGAVASFQSFSVIGSGNTTYYTIATTADWEVGIGTYTAPDQLSRDTVIASSNAGALVNLGAGTKDVFVTLPAEEAVYLNGQNIYAPNAIVSKNIITVDDTAASGYTAVLGVDANGYAVIGGSYSVFGPINQAVLAPNGLQLGDSNTAVVTINAAPTSAYTLNFPPTAGSANQVLKTDGFGNLNWTPVQINTDIQIPAVVNIGVTTGIIQMVDGGDGYDYLQMYTWDGISAYKVDFPGGITMQGNLETNGFIAVGAGFIAQGNGTNSGTVEIRNAGSSTAVFLTVPVGLSPSYTLTLPGSAGSANQVLKTDGSGATSWTTQGVQGTAPVTVTTATHTVAATTQWIIGNNAGTITLTLPTASTNTGRSLNIKTIQAQTVVSASSNVVPLNGGAAGTAILAATIGKYATLVSDGTNWIIMQAN